MADIQINAPLSGEPKKWWQLTLTQQIMLGLVLGIVLGWAVSIMPKDGTGFFSYNGIMELFRVMRGVFLNMIKSIIAPLVFATIVVGIAGGDKKIGKLGVKAMTYFLVATTLALVIGLVIVNITQPGIGVTLAGGDMDALGKIKESHPKTPLETILHAFPSSIIAAMAQGDVLQIVVFSVLFGVAAKTMGAKAAPIVRGCEALSKIMFQFTEYIMRFAPYGVGAAMAATVAHQGLDVLWNLAKLVGSLYLALVVFVVLVLGAAGWWAKLPWKQFWKAVKEPFVLAFVTTSSESALPKAMENMERLGVPKHIVGFVMPLGYSFNLDGSTLYLAMASVFVAQIVETMTGVHMGWETQLAMMFTLLISSKGVAAVPRASLVVLASTVASFGLPLEGVAIIIAVDELMDMARTSVNLLGNCVANVVVARWEGEFDDERAAKFGTPEELPLVNA